MPKFKKKTFPRQGKYKRMTGEDIAMLRDKKAEGTLRSYSPAYKDDIDGA